MKSIIAIGMLTVLYSCNGGQQQKEPTINHDSTNVKKVYSIKSKTFGDPNSPYRNEDSFIAVLQSELQSQWYSVIEKESIQKQLTLTLQNRPGHPANDFTYTTPSAQKKKLYDIKTNQLLLFFYNPECEACIETKAAIIASPTISKQIKTGQLKILAIYTDKDETIWHKHLPENPSTWLNGKDENEHLYKNNIYNLKAIPTLYLLDKDKKVLLKDCVVEEIDGRL